MLFKNNFQEEEIYQLSNQVCRLIKNEPQLTNRKLRTIRDWMRSGSLYAILKGNRLIGFIVKERITGNFYEIKSLLVRRKERRKGWGEKLIRETVKEKSANYLISTFQGNIVRKTAKFGFKETTLTKLPLKIALKYVLSKKLISLFKHLFKKRSVLLIKDATN